ncbi:hypothetical protein [Tumebacillus flagellatus]|uniref:Uncharacterized protein n=1 Tax=Tumebacillus flagellatus TaxID=1157490 RepID=A0A074LMB8_9BACL|nr:hypothetical protein [Tumebacillus flagellatus]KEO81655.1 hypothetical protein EL26_19475 [Tumebacillus flagellatus]
MRLPDMTVHELEELYYARLAAGADLLELKSIRTLQEAKLRKLPLEERAQLTREIRNRYFEKVLSPSARDLLNAQRK